MSGVYILIFLSIVATGEIAWIPLLYLGYLGKINFQEIVLIGMSAVFVADTLWYLLGRLVGSRILEFAVFKKKIKTFENFFDFFHRKQISIIFFAKFFYGTRVVAQVLAGAHKIKYNLFFVITTLATFIWTGLLILIVYIVGETLQGVQETVRNVQISISIFVLFFILVNLLIRRFFFKKTDLKNRRKNKD